MPHIRHFDDLYFTVVATPSKCAVDFSIYEIGAIDDGDLRIYSAKDRYGHDETESLDEAQLFAHGSVKWDGCSNWYFDQQDEVMIHGCCRDHLTRIGQILAECWDWAATLIPEAWDPC